MIFRQFLHESRSCVSYLVGCPSRGVAAIVDPQGSASDYEAAVDRHGLRITDVIETHVHADHVSVAREVADRSGATLWMGAGADDVQFAHASLRDGDEIAVGNREFRAIHTPGHTHEHVCLLIDDWFVLTGDTLFVGDVGRVDLALDEVDDRELRRRARALHTSLRRLLELRDDVEVYPGHYAGSTCGRGLDGKTITTIGRERRTNPVLRLDLDDFVDFQLSNVPPVPERFEAIKRANLGMADGRSIEVLRGGDLPERTRVAARRRA